MGLVFYYFLTYIFYDKLKKYIFHTDLHENVKEYIYVIHILLLKTFISGKQKY